MSNFKMVNDHMRGRIAMLAREAELVEKYAALCDTWLEIGTLWGGSAILAALANPSLTVTAVDPMYGYYGSGDSGMDGKPTPTLDDVQSNFREFEVFDRISLVQGKSNPFPLPALLVDGILVDGAHDYESVLLDCREACQHARRFVLVHDVNDAEVDRAVHDGIAWSAWCEVEASLCMRVLERKE